MSTVRDLINSACRKIGVLAEGESLSAQGQTDAFNALNWMVEDWSNQRLFIPSILREAFPMVQGQQTYVMGNNTTTQTPDFLTVRPQKIENALVEIQMSPEAELPIKIVNKDQFAGVIVKSTQSSIPLYLYPDFSYPNMNINLWPVPSVNSNLILYSWKPLTSFVTVNDTLSLPQGYPRALIYNLALELAPEYGKNPNALLLAQAIESKENIKRLNIEPQYMTIDEALLTNASTFNWLTGE